MRLKLSATLYKQTNKQTNKQKNSIIFQYQTTSFVSDLIVFSLYQEKQRNKFEIATNSVGL